MLRERVKRRKNFLPALLLTVLLWTVWLAVFFFAPPETFLMPFVFLTLTFLAILFSATLLFANTRRGFLTALGLTAFMLLNFYGIGNYLNLLLIVGVLLAAEYYFSR